MPIISLPERIDCLTDLKQTLFFFVHENFKIYGDRKNGILACLVPSRVRDELAKHIATKKSGHVTIVIASDNLPCRLIMWLRGFRKL